MKKVFVYIIFMFSFFDNLSANNVKVVGFDRGKVKLSMKQASA